MRKYGRELLAAAVVFAATCAVYGPARNYELVDYDDNDYVFKNAHIHEGLTRENVRWALTSHSYAANWHPLCWMSLQADAELELFRRGGRPFSAAEREDHASPLARVMHVHNILLHAANAVLLLALMLMLMRKLGGRSPSAGALDVWTAGFLALLWALHPLRVEVVCWVSERKELVSVFFMLLTLIAYCGASRTSRPAGYVLSLFTFSLALLAKPVAVTLPAVLFAWDWVIAGRRFRMSLVRSVPFALLSAATCVATMKAQTLVVEGARSYPLSGRLSGFFGGPLIYLGQFLWPVDLSIGYAAPYRFCLRVWLLFAGGVLLLALMAGVCVWWLRRRDRWTGLGAFVIAWSYVGLLPMLGIVKVGGEEHSDRYTYWVGCGLAVGCCVALRWLCERRDDLLRAPDGRKERVFCAAAAVLLLCSWGTRKTMAPWHDTFPLFRKAVVQCWTPPCVDLLVENILMRGGPHAWEEARRWLWEAVRHTECAEAYAAYAEHLLTRINGKMASATGSDPFEEAEYCLKIALECEPDNERAKKSMEFIERKRKEWGGNVPK